MLRDARPYYVYVIESSVHGRSVLYVGQSAHRPSVRLREHQECHTYCSSCRCRHYVRGRKARLRRDLMRGWGPYQGRPAAEKAEKQLARRLRRLGYKVSGGH